MLSKLNKKLCLLLDQLDLKSRNALKSTIILPHTHNDNFQFLIFNFFVIGSNIIFL